MQERDAGVRQRQGVHEQLETALLEKHGAIEAKRGDHRAPRLLGTCAHGGIVVVEQVLQPPATNRECPTTIDRRSR